ncbi:MAG: hypothetical protein Q7U38_17865 [Methylobacter sp.]|nr:hypothetical protein [Methylobacter sp.]MDP2099120.1 hypothetical protein [Methylobacter sp.]MDP2429946.1 hypothetical protein [Methylobacter sp.]MDP3054791.1 hypothetical protein [Methylobacter sp.]MDP3361225.1 hypothetical protein [Methylobacter sp.]
MTSLAEMGEARARVLDYVEQTHKAGGSIAAAISWFNVQYAARRLPKTLQRKAALAWQKPRDCILTESTYGKWVKQRKERGHSLPLVRQKEVGSQPWHSLAHSIRQRSPKQKHKAMLAQLHKTYPDISIHQLRRLYAVIDKELAQ